MRGEIQRARERFYEKTMPVTETGCILWIGAVTRRLYGKVCLSGRTTEAHRAALILEGKVIPSRMEVCHACDTTLCVNTKHLFLANHAGNMRDMAIKGRRQTKLTIADVEAIRKSTDFQFVIASKFGISQGSVSKIKSRQRRQHV